MPNTYRWVLCVDVEEAESLSDAYGKVFEAMNRISGKGTGILWGSTDEAYWFNGEYRAIPYKEAIAAKSAYHMQQQTLLSVLKGKSW